MQPTEWEKIFINHISNNGLVYKLYKELLQLNNKKTKRKNKNPVKNRQNFGHLTEEDIQISNKQVKT